MNINEGLTGYLKKLREAVEDNENELDINDIDDTDLDDFDDFEDQDFGDSEVATGNMFDTDGDIYEWDKPYSDTIEYNGNTAQVWSAINTEYDETEYFIVSLEDSYIIYGPVDDLDDARDYLQTIEEDSEIEESLCESGKINCGNYSLVQNLDKSYSVIKESKEYKFRDFNKAKAYFKESVNTANKLLKESIDICINEAKFDSEDTAAYALMERDAKNYFKDLLKKYNIKESTWRRLLYPDKDAGQVYSGQINGHTFKFYFSYPNFLISANGVPVPERLFLDGKKVDLFDSRDAHYGDEIKNLEHLIDILVDDDLSQIVYESLSKLVSDGINESLNEDFIMMIPQEFELNQVLEIQMPECPCTNTDDMGIVYDAASKVMEAYQNANKWLDIIKEEAYSGLSCVFFSSFIHQLAHTMPLRFDKFGDILHTMNIKIPYPATQYIPQEPQNIDDIFSLVFMILDAIKAALNEFIKVTDENYHGMACAAEALLNDIEEEYPMWFRLKADWEQCNGDNIKFDKYVNQYIKNKDDLVESLLNESTEK